MLGDLGRVCSPLPSCFAVFSENFNFFLLFSECFQFPCSQFLVGCGDFSLFAAVFSLFSCFPYQNPDLSTEERISDLMSRMTLEEKILQTDQYYSGDFTTQDENGKVTAVDMQRFDALMQHNSVGSVQLRGMTAAQANVVQRYAIENTRLGIPYLFSEEALHGLMTNNATSFPQQIGLAASFEPELGREMGHAIAAESRACGIHETYSPVMDLIRDPRYGRAEESYGEDTYLCAEFARETVLGIPTFIILR